MPTQIYYPAQICQFHIQTRISNNLFIKNKLTEKELGRTLALYCRVNYHFLSERNEEGRYTHRRIIKALRCFKRKN